MELLMSNENLENSRIFMSFWKLIIFLKNCNSRFIISINRSTKSRMIIGLNGLRAFYNFIYMSKIYDVTFYN